MLDNFFEKESALKRQQQFDEFVSKGLISEDQARSALQQTPSIGQMTDPVPNVRVPIGVVAQQKEAATPSYQDRMRAVEQDVENIYRRTYGQGAPTLQNTLRAYAENPEIGGAQRTNAAEAVPKVTFEHNAAFDSLSSNEAKERVISRIISGVPIDTALGSGHLNMGLGWLYETADAPNRWNNWVNEGYGGPMMKKAWDESYEKWSIGAPVAMGLGIIRDTIVGGVTGVRDIAQGDATLGDFLHVMSLAAIPFTMGASAAAAGSKAVYAGITMQNAARYGRVLTNFQKLNKMSKRVTRGEPGTLGGLNVGQWKNMGAITRVSTAAELAEIGTNPEEMWWEILGDVGLQGSVRAFQGSSEWITDRLANPENRMRDLEKGVEKRLNRVRKMDAGMAAAFQTMFDNLEGQVGTEVSEARIAAIDTLIEGINDWESNTKFNWMTRQHENADENTVVESEVMKAIQSRIAEINAQDNEATQTANEPAETVAPQPTPTPQPTVEPTPTPQPTPAPETVEQPAPVADTPTPAPETEAPAPATGTPETSRMRELAQDFEGVPLENLELGEIEGINLSTFEQDTEEQNAVVRQKIEEKAEQVYTQGERFLDAVDAAKAARAEADANPDNDQLQRDANTADQAADQAFENWLNVISAEIGREVEGEGEGNERYIADEEERAREYLNLGERFLMVSSVMPVDAESASPEEAFERTQAKGLILNSASKALQAHADGEDISYAPEPAETPPEPEPETPAVPIEFEREVPTPPETQAAEEPQQTIPTEPEPQAPPQPALAATPQKSIIQRVADAVNASDERLSAADVATLASTEASALTTDQVKRALRTLRKRVHIHSERSGNQTLYFRVGAEPEVAPEVETPAPEPAEATVVPEEDVTPTPTPEPTLADDAQETFNQAKSGEIRSSSEIGVNAMDRRRSGQQLDGSYGLDPVWATEASGYLEAYQIGSSDRHVVLPRKTLNLTDALYGPGALSEVFDIPGYEGGSDVIQSSDVNVVRPAIFEKSGDRWNLVEKGEIDVGRQAPEPEAETPAQPSPLDRMFDKAKARARIRRTESDDTVLSPEIEEVEENPTDEALNLLETGAVEVADLQNAVTTLQARIEDLSDGRVLSEDEFDELDAARETIYHYNDAIGIWQGRTTVETVPDLIDGVLYFKYDESSGPFKSLSNFFPISIGVRGKSYPSVEHYFQSQKFADSDLKMTITDRDGNTETISVADGIRRASHPGVAFNLANEHFNRLSESEREEWNDRRNQVMVDALLAKFTSPTQYKFNADGESKTLAQWLLDTGDTPLVHIEHVTTERRAVDNSPPYWGGYHTPNATQQVTDAEGNVRTVPARWTGFNQLGRLLETLRAEIRSGSVVVPEGTEDARMLSVADLPEHIRSAMESLNINVQHLHTFRNIESIIERIHKGDIVVGVGGARTHRSGRKYIGPNTPKPPDRLRREMEELAMDLGFITDPSEYNAEVESRVNVYNDTQQSGADAAYAVAQALGDNGVIASGGAAGTDVSAIQGAVGTIRHQGKGSALVMMPEGIQKRPPNWEGYDGPPVYNPNVKVLDDPRKKIAAVSLHPPEYDANERLSASGTPTYTKGLMDRNGLVVSFSHVFFATHAVSKTGSGTVNAAEKALQAGRPVVILDPELFDYPLEGSEYLASLPGVYVIRHTPEFPIFTEPRKRNPQTNAVEKKKHWIGKNILSGIQSVAELHYPEAPFAALRKDNLKELTRQWTEVDFKNRLTELRGRALSENNPYFKMLALAEIAGLNRLRAENHKPPNKSSPVNYSYVTQLTEEESAITGSMIGFWNYNNFDDFFFALKQAGVKVFVDVRQNTYDKSRDENGRYVDNWSHGPLLMQSFADTDIKYVHAAQFTPRTGVRQYQIINDSIASIRKAHRGVLGSGFTAAYQNFLRKTKADLGMFLKDMIGMHVGTENAAGSSICFACVEHESRACHRSILGEIMRDVLGVRVKDIHAGGLTTDYHPQSRDAAALPELIHSGKTAVVVTESNKAYIPGNDSLLELIDYSTDAENAVQSLRYRHPDYPMWEILLSRAPDNTINFGITKPRTETAALLEAEARMESELGGPEQITPFVSQTQILPGYKKLSFDSENIPIVAEHALSALAPSVNNPGLYFETESIESALDDPLYPMRGSKLQARRVQINTPAEGYVTGRTTRRVGERIVMGQEHQTRDEDQRVEIVQEGISPGTREDLTEYETYHYSWVEMPDLEVRLSPSAKFISVVVPEGREIEIPANFPLNVHIHQAWEDFRKTQFAAGQSESEALYEYLSTHRFLWQIVNEDQARITTPPDGLPPSVRNLPRYISNAVYGGMTEVEAEADWRRVRAFMARARASRAMDLRDMNPEEVAAARRFILRSPEPPNILTQVYRYLASAHRATKRLDRGIDTPTMIPDYMEHRPHVLNAGQLSETTNEMVGMTQDLDADVEIEQEEERVTAQDIETDTEGQPETPEGAEVPEETIETTDELGETADVSETEAELAEYAAEAGGAAGVPLPSQIQDFYQREWFDRFERVATNPANGFDVMWENGSIRVRAPQMERTPEGRWQTTGEVRKGSFQDMVKQTDRQLRLLLDNRSISDADKVNIMGIQKSLLEFDRNNGFDDLSLWEEDNSTLKSALNVFGAAHRLVSRYTGVNLQLTGHLLTNLPYAGTMGNGNSRRLDYVLTNTGVLVPVNEMHRYVVDPDTQQVNHRPPTQLQMIVDVMEETDPNTGETVPVTRFYADKNRNGQSYEVVDESDEVLDARVVGAGYNVKFVKDDLGRIVLSDMDADAESHTIYVEGWKDVPLNTTNETLRALAPVAIAVRDGYFANTSGIALELYHINMNNEGSWSYRLKGPVGFDWGPEGVVVADDYSFSVSVVPGDTGFVYEVGAYRLVGEETIVAPIFRTPEGTPTNTITRLIEDRNKIRAPHEAISAALWAQRKAAVQQGWDLPETPDTPFTERVDFERPPNIQTWESTANLSGEINTNDVFFQPWDLWSEEIRRQYGTEIVQAAEMAVFQSELPIHSRSQAWAEIAYVLDQAEASPELERMFELALPGLLAARYEAQNTWTPKDEKFVRLPSVFKVEHRYRKMAFFKYTLDILEGGDVADVKFDGESIGQIDYSTSENMWDAIDGAYEGIVRDHIAKRQAADLQYDRKDLPSGDVVYQRRDNMRRVRFDATNPFVIGETRADTGWQPQEYTRHLLESVYTGMPTHRQFEYVQRIHQMLFDRDLNVETSPEQIQERQATPGPSDVSHYMGPVIELPPDIDDHINTVGPTPVRVRRFEMLGHPIEIHLLPPDKFHPDDTQTSVRRREDGTRVFSENEYWESAERDDGDVWRRVVFFDKDRGKYVQYNTVTQEWTPDPYTFEAEPITAFGRMETGELPAFEYPSDPAAFPEDERKGGFAELRQEVRDAESQYRQDTIWMRVESASDSLIKQKVEDIYRTPGTWNEHDTRPVQIRMQTTIAADGTTTAKEIQTRNERFVNDLRIYNMQSRQDGSTLPRQPETGLTPDGVMVSVPGTSTSLESLGMTADGDRSYLTAHGWELIVTRTAPDAFSVAANHVEAGATLTLDNLPEVGFDVVKTRLAHFASPVAEIYENGGLFENGEEQVTVNSFDNAAILAAQLTYHYANDNPEYSALLRQYQDVNVAVEAFIEAPEIFDTFTDRRMDKYRQALKDTLSEEEKTAALAEFEAFETYRRQLQNGMELGVSQYYKQQKTLERQLESAGIEINLKPRMRRFLPGISTQMPEFSAIRDEIDRKVNNVRQANALKDIVDSLQAQYGRLTVGYAQQINEVELAVKDLKNRYFGIPVYDRFERNIETAEAGQRRQALDEANNARTIAYLSNFLNKDEMSGLLLGTHPASAAFNYLFNMDEMHPGYGLVLDIEEFDADSGNLTLESAIGKADADALFSTFPEASGAIGEHTAATVISDNTVVGAYTFTENPFIRMNVISQQFEAGAAPAFERIKILVEPRFAHTTRGRDIIDVEIELEDTERTVVERLAHLPELVEQFSLANYSILSSWLNPVAGHKVKVKESTETSRWNGREHVVYQINDTLNVQLLSVADGEWVVGFEENGELVELTQDPTELAAAADARIGELADEETSEADVVLVENADMLGLQSLPQELNSRVFTNFVTGETAYTALQKVILQKLSSGEMRNQLSAQLNNADNFTSVGSRVANNFVSDVAGVEDEGADVERGLQTGPLDRSLLERIPTLIEQRFRAPTQVGSRYTPRESDETVESSFFSAEHPVLTDILPIGAEDIHHPDTREFIARHWHDFAERFNAADAAGRIAILEKLADNWEMAYKTRWETASMTGAMLDIRQLAARSALTTWLSRHPDITYENLVRYSASLADTEGEVSPHLAYAAVRSANIRETDSVRVDDAGDGLVSTFLGEVSRDRSYADPDALRRAIFNQMYPNRDIAARLSGPTDVRFTENRAFMSPSVLLTEVAPGGRLVIYGDSDWHQFSAEIIGGKLSIYETVEKYEASLPRTLDNASRALHLQLFSAWKGLGHNVKVLHFDGDNSSYASESGAVIVVDNKQGTDTGYESFNLTNPQERPFDDYESSFDAVGATRHGTPQEIMEQEHRNLLIERRKREAKARSDAAINDTLNAGTSPEIYKSYPKIALKVKTRAKQAQTGNLIPQGTHYGSIEELTIVADLARNPTMPTTQVLLVANDTVQASVLGGIRSGEDVRAKAEDIVAMVPQTEAVGYDVITVVNRPSGDTTISDADIAQARALGEAYPGFKYLLIKNGDTYSTISVNRDAEGNLKSYNKRENVPINRDQQQIPIDTVDRPSWRARLESQRSVADDLIATVHENFENIHSDHISVLSQIVESDDDWAVVAMMNQDGTLADMVEIPNAFNLDQSGIASSISRIKGLYGGADAYVFLASSRHITENPNFFNDTGWGAYLSSSPDIRGHMLVGAGSNHRVNRVREHPVQPQTPDALRTLAKEVSPNVAADVPAHLEQLIISPNVQGNIWEHAKAYYVQTLNRDFTRTQSLTALEEQGLRNQINVAYARLIHNQRIRPGSASGADALDAFMKLQAQSAKWREKTTLPLNGARLSVSPAHAYLMHHLAGVADNEVVVIPDAAEGMLASFDTFTSHVMLTEPDPAKRAYLRNVFGFRYLNEASAENLADFWGQSETLAEISPNVVMLDSRSPEAFWRQLNQGLHTVEPGGRVVARLSVDIDPEALEQFRSRTEMNLNALKEHYQLRMFSVHEGNLIVVADRVETPDANIPTIQKVYEDSEELLKDADAIRGTRRGLVQPRETESAPEAILEPLQGQSEFTPEAEAEEQAKHTKPEELNVNAEETHRQWVERTNSAIGDRFDVSDPRSAKSLYEDMIRLARSVERENRSEADIRADIYNLWETRLLGYTPDTGWERFIARLTASTFSVAYDPEMVYKLKLYELLDSEAMASRNMDIRGILDPRTDEVDTLISTSYNLSHNRPINLIGETVASAQDAAILFQPFRNPSYEQYVLIGVDDNNKVVGNPVGITAQHGYASRGIDNFEIQRILANNPEMKGFYIVHNHPELESGPSSTDRDNFSRKNRRFQGQFKGFIITDTGEYSALMPDGNDFYRQPFSRSVEEHYRRRPAREGILGESTAFSTPESIADLVRGHQLELANAPDQVTFVFVRPEIDAPGGNSRMQVSGYETHQNLHALDPEGLKERIRDMNSRHGAYQTFMIVNNPSDAGLYGSGSTWDAVLREASENPLVSGVFVETQESNFPYKNAEFDTTRNVQQGLTTRLQGNLSLGATPVDMSTGRPVNARKQRKFTEFLLFNYLAHNNQIDFAEAREYADRYFDEDISDNMLQQMGDIAFNEWLDIEGFSSRMTTDVINIEAEYLMVDHLYRRMVNPASREAGAPESVGRSDVFNRGFVEHLTYLGLNLESGETLDYAYELLPKNSPLRRWLQADGVNRMSSNLLFPQHNRNTEEGDGSPRTPTASIEGIGEFKARGGVEGEGADPLATVRDKLINLADRGRLVVLTDGGTFRPGQPRAEMYSGTVSGEESISLNTPLLSRVIPAFLEEKVGNISIEERNKRWRLTQEETDYYHAMLNEVLNPEKYTMRAFIRLSEYQSHWVIDKMPATGDAVDVAVNPRPDIRTLVEKYVNLRYTRPKVSSKHLRHPEEAQPPRGTQPPVFGETPDMVLSPTAESAMTYQAEIAARTGLETRQPAVRMQDSEFGTSRSMEFGDIVESPLRQSIYPQIMVKGLEGRVSRDALEAAFKAHGEVTNIVVDQNYGNNVAWVIMNDEAEADAAITALNGQIMGSVVLDVARTERDVKTPIETLPTGDPDSVFAWDVFLNSRFLPDSIRKKWMAIFDIEEVGEADRRTFLRKAEASALRKGQTKWQSFWKGRGGENLSRPIDHIQRWGEPGRKIAELASDCYWTARARAGDAQAEVMGIYNTIKSNPAVRDTLKEGSVEKIYSSQAGFLPAWVKKVPGVQVWVDKKANVERVMHKGEQLTHQQADGRWATELFLSNAPLLDAWIQSYFDTQSYAVFPNDPEVRNLIQTELEKIRQLFDRQDMEKIMANEQILSANLLSPIDDEGVEDITDALANDNLNVETVKAYASRFGIQMPSDVEIHQLRKRGTMRQWSIVAADGTRELFRLRQFDSQQSVIASARRDPQVLDELSPAERKRHVDSLDYYKKWTNRTLLYGPNPRNPIWTKKSGIPFQLFSGRPHSMPKMINWASMNPYDLKEESRERQAYEDYKKVFFELNANLHRNDPGWMYNGEEWTETLADKILKQNFNGFNDMRFDPLEDDSELVYPSVAFESLPVLGEYALKSAQRTAEILKYGQDGDILKATLDELTNPDNLELDDVAKSVYKLRRALGHNDFEEVPETFIANGNMVVPFHLSGGVRRTTRPDMDEMTPNDWQTLIDAGIVTLVETNEGREGFYGWADPSETPGENIARQPWETGGEVEFEIAPSAGVLVNTAILNPDGEVAKVINEANYRYATAKDMFQRMHTWNPKLIEVGELERKIDAIYASDPLTRAALEHRKNDIMEREFVEIVRNERSRRNNPVYRGLRNAQNLATFLLMRLSWASQFGTFHNPIHRTNFVNFAKGTINEFTDPSERERVGRVGAYLFDMSDMISMSAENVSQENIGWTQKMLGTSKYFDWNYRNYGGITDYMRALYNRGNFTPFAFMERRLRGTASLAGKHLAKDALTELLIPGKIKAEGDALAARRQQHINALNELDVTIPSLLRAVLELKDPETGKQVQWTDTLIDQLTEMSEKEALDTFNANPHLAIVSKLTDRMMQAMPDYAHYAGTRMHMPRVLQDHPFLRILVLFQTMMFAQTQNMVKMLRYNFNQMRMPEQMARERAGADGLPITEAMKLTSRETWRMLPHFMLSAGAVLGAGFLTTVMADLVRGRTPDDEDLAPMVWVTNAAVFGALTGYIESAGHYKGIPRQVAGPLANLAGDFLTDPVRTTTFYGLRPFPIDFRPWIDIWTPDETQDVGRSIATGGFRPGTGTSLSGVRAP